MTFFLKVSIIFLFLTGIVLLPTILYLYITDGNFSLIALIGLLLSILFLLGAVIATVIDESIERLDVFRDKLVGSIRRKLARYLNAKRRDRPS